MEIPVRDRNLVSRVILENKCEQGCTKSKGLCQIFRIQGDPTPRQTARVSDRYKVYDPQKNLKLLHGIEIQRQFESVHDWTTQQLEKVPLLMEITFAFAIPKTSIKRKYLIAGSSHYNKPDLSNCLKHIEDVLSGIVYDDDSRIAKTIARKIWDQEGYTEFKVSVINDKE